MREYTVQSKDDGRRLDRVMRGVAPSLPVSKLQQYIRAKRVTVNGARIGCDARVHAGDTVQLDIGDEWFTPVKRIDALLASFHPHIRVLYEDEQLLLIDKRPGMLVHPDAHEKVDTLITHVRAYLYQKGAYDSMAEGAFAPTPCNRIDRFTGGIVLFARTKTALDAVNGMIRARAIDKSYLLITRGAPTPASGTLEHDLVKDEKNARVHIATAPVSGAQHAITRYRTIKVERDLALVECTLVTGRTHQIRAQFAAIEHPLLGDTQYGDRALNDKYKMYAQALYAYKIAFQNGTSALNVSGKTFEVAHVPFVDRFFPNTTTS